MAKILVVGDICGYFDQIFSKVSQINQKNGPFDCLFCVGNFSNGCSLDEFPSSVPIPTYFITSDQDINIPSSNSLCPNLHFLGSCGTITLYGMEIAYISSSAYDNPDDISSLFSFSETPDYKGIDILLSSDWPAFFRNEYEKQNPESKLSLSSPILSTNLDHLISQLCPRYHFSAISNRFYQYPPYHNQHRDFNHATRFIALASVNNILKDRYFYAIDIQPLSTQKSFDDISSLPSCPFFKPNKKRLLSPIHTSSLQTQSLSSCPRWDITPPSDYICRICHISGHYIQFCPKAGQKKVKKLPSGYICKICQKPGHHIQDCPQKNQKSLTSSSKRSHCWFCLSSPDFESHMLISIGSEIYLASTKGGLVPYHLLLLSISHYPAITSYSEDTLTELSLYKKSLIDCFHSFSPPQVVLFFERYLPLKDPCHSHLHVIPLPSNVISTILPSLKTVAERHNITFSQLNQPLIDIVRSDFYLFFELPDHTSWIYRYDANIPLKSLIHFGREVYCLELHFIDGLHRTMPECIDGFHRTMLPEIP